MLPFLKALCPLEPAFSILRQPWKTFRRVWWRSKEGCEGTQAALKRLLLREKERAIAFAKTEAEMQDKLNQTYNLMVDSRFRVSPKKPKMIFCFPKDGIETIDAAYEVFLNDGFEGFQQFSFEFKTIARKNLSPKRIEEYLTVIHRQSGAAKCREVLEYVVMALTKYLQITVAYDILKGDLEKISCHFELFNEHLEALAVVFRLVTNTEFQQQNKISTLPTLQVI